MDNLCLPCWRNRNASMNSTVSMAESNMQLFLEVEMRKKICVCYRCNTGVLVMRTTQIHRYKTSLNLLQRQKQQQKLPCNEKLYKEE